MSEMDTAAETKRGLADFRAVLIACCIAMLSVGDNSTAIHGGVAGMKHDLALEAAAAERAVNAYLLAAAVFIVLGGEAADRFGARYSSTAGIALFAPRLVDIAVAPTGAVVTARGRCRVLAALLPLRDARGGHRVTAAAASGRDGGMGPGF